MEEEQAPEVVGIDFSDSPGVTIEIDFNEDGTVKNYKETPDD